MRQPTKGYVKIALDKGYGITELAKEHEISIGTITSFITKNDLAQNTPPPPSHLSHMGARRWCAEHCARIPDKIQNSKEDAVNTIVVFGSKGFVGTNLVQSLTDNIKSSGAKTNVLVPDRYAVDLLNADATTAYVKERRPDIIINLAALVGGIGLNQRCPATLMHQNLLIGLNVVEAAVIGGVKKLLNIGTVCAYPLTPPHIPFIEDDLWEGRPERTNEGYGVAKKTIGLLLGAYKQQMNFNSAYLIPTNMYGPHDDFNNGSSHVIPAMIKKFMRAAKNGDKEVVLWGDGTATRDFLYVDDFCYAIQLAIDKINDPHPINIGSGTECSIMTLADMIARLCDYSGKINWDISKPNGQPRRQLDTTVAEQRLGFTPKTELAEGLQKTIAWCRANEAVLAG